MVWAYYYCTAHTEGPFGGKAPWIAIGWPAVMAVVIARNERRRNGAAGAAGAAAVGVEVDTIAG